MKPSKTARFAVRRADARPVRGAIEAFVEAIEANEPGTLTYLAFSRGDDPVEFLHVMTFRDLDAEAVHRSTAAVLRFTGIVYPLTIDGVTFDDWVPVAGTAHEE
jgi:quinol monooxygenase YgiN